MKDFLKIEIDTRQALAEIKQDREQIPFALALSLTWTAKAGQKLIQTGVLPRKFTLRRAAWEKAGVRIEKATKATLTAVVKDIHAYMALQEEGGTKYPFGKYVAVPLKGARPTPSTIIREADRPKSVMANGGKIIVANGTPIIVRVASRGNKKKGITRGQLVPMYMLIPNAVIRARFDFRKSIIDMVQGGEWDRQFDQAFKHAVETRDAKALANSQQEN